MLRRIPAVMILGLVHNRKAAQKEERHDNAYRVPTQRRRRESIPFEVSHLAGVGAYHRGLVLVELSEAFVAAMLIMLFTS